MLNNLSDQIRSCYDRAEEVRRQADTTIDPALKASLLDMERRWLVLAQSYGFAESLGEFTKESKRWQQQQSIEGAAASNRLQPDEMRRLQEISTLLIQESDLYSLYNRILDAAVELMESDMASMQEFQPERDELRLLAWKGFHPQSAAFWDCVRIDSASSCAAALSQGRRVIVPNIEASDFILGTPDADEYARSGIRAVQSTPLISRSGRLLGMISTHWSKVHRPPERALRALDVLARQAADLIERSISEMRLRESEQRARQLAAVVESSDDGIVSLDLKGTVTTWNKAAERLFGHSAEEALGMPLLSLLPAERHHEESANFERIRRGERVEPYDTVRKCKDGSLVHVSLSISPILDLSGAVVGASEILRDISQRKMADEQIAMLAREAEHRTKNVLATVQSIVRLSQAETPDELKQAITGRINALSNVHAQFARTRWVSADILTLAREELAPYLTFDRPRIRIDGPQVAVAPQAAQAIAVLLHELATNAAKYGALSSPDGQLMLRLERISQHSLALRWIETGGPPVSLPSREGCGTELMQRLARLCLRGKLHFDWRAEGLACEIEINQGNDGDR